MTTSARFNSLCWEAQSLYVRLITLVDDYGRFEAHPVLLKSLAFPFNPEIICEQMLSWCVELQAKDLAVFYEKDGKQYVQLSRWQEKARSHSKFPQFDASTCKQMLASVSKCSAPSSSPSPSPSPIVELCLGKVSSQKPCLGAVELLNHLNKTSGRDFRPTEANLEFIESRLKESGVTVEGCKQMIDRQCKRWLGTDQAEYLRPSTLFNRSKFDGYYAAKGVAVNGPGAKPQPQVHNGGNY